MGCEIDYCEGRDAKILTVASDDSEIYLKFCAEHAEALRRRLAEQLGVDERFVVLTRYGGTFGELQEAIDYLDGLASRAN